MDPIQPMVAGSMTAGPRFARKFRQHWRGCTSRSTPGQSAWCVPIGTINAPSEPSWNSTSLLGPSRNTQSAHLPFGSGRSSRLHRRLFGFVHSAMTGSFMHCQQPQVLHFDAAWQGDECHGQDDALPMTPHIVSPMGFDFFAASHRNALSGDGLRALRFLIMGLSRSVNGSMDRGEPWCRGMYGDGTGNFSTVSF